MRKKYLKALLEEHNITFPRIHDLVALLNLSGGLIPELAPLKPRLAHLSIFGIASRYPGVKADRQAAEEAMTRRKKCEPSCAQSSDFGELPLPAQ